MNLTIGANLFTIPQTALAAPLTGEGTRCDRFGRAGTSAGGTSAMPALRSTPQNLFAIRYGPAASGTRDITGPICGKKLQTLLAIPFSGDGMNLASSGSAPLAALLATLIAELASFLSPRQKPMGFPKPSTPST